MNPAADEEQVSCEEYLELIPLAANKTLDDNQARLLTEHLETCEACRQVVAREQALMRMAARAGNQLLDEALSAERLDLFARTPDELNPEQRAATAEAIAGDRLSLELVSKLRDLPESLDQLAESTALPLIEKIEKRVESHAVGRWTFRPRLAVAAAAAVLLIAMAGWYSAHRPPLARVQVLLPTSMRRAQAATFEIPSDPAVVTARFFVDPEGGHRYALEVVASANRKTVYVNPSLTEFDRDGFARFTDTLAAGAYELIVYDIFGADTLRAVCPFCLTHR